MCFVQEARLAHSRPLIHLLNKQTQQDMRLSQKRILHNPKAWPGSIAGNDQYEVWLQTGGPRTGTRDGHRVVEGNVSQGRAGQPGSRGEEQDAGEVGLGGAVKETRIQVCKLTWLASRADGQEDPKRSLQLRPGDKEA